MLPATADARGWRDSMGEYPADWDVTELGSRLRRIEAGSSPNLPDRPAQPGEWGVLKVSAVRSWGFDPKENKVVTDDSLIDHSVEVRHGDLLITRANTPALIGLACYVQNPPDRLLLCDKTLRLVVDEQQLDPRYASYVLGLPNIRRQIETSGTGSSAGMKNISQVKIRSLRLCLPGIQEQRRIVKILNEAGESIWVVERTIDKLDQVKHAIMWDLLGGQQSRSAGWKSYAIGELLDSRPRSGYSPSAASQFDGIYMLGLGCLTSDGFVPSQLKYAPSDDPLVSRALLARGDLLISRANTRDLVGLVGRYTDVGHPCIYPDLMMRLRPGAGVLPEFLELVLRSPSCRRQIQAVAVGTSESMVKISSASLRAIRVVIPSIAEQKAILMKIDAVVDDRRAAVRELEKIRAVRRGLMVDLLTGRVRIKAGVAG
jgi:type I restriction enzyme, S subunit